MELITNEIITVFDEKYIEFVIDNGDGSNFINIWFYYTRNGNSNVYSSVIMIYNTNKIIHYFNHTRLKYTYSEINKLINNIDNYSTIYNNN